MSDNLLSGYTDKQMLELLLDMAEGKRRELADARRRIAELEAKLSAVPVGEIRAVMAHAFGDDRCTLDGAIVERVFVWLSNG